jgi:dihydropteroate synthase
MFSFLGNVKVGDSLPVRIMGTINLSPESFYKGSIAIKEGQILKKASAMIEQGADLLDVGAYSTAPYLNTRISKEEEIKRIERALRVIREVDRNIAISVDTFRAEVAERAFYFDAQVINDVTGLEDRMIARVVREHDGSLIIMAYDPDGKRKDKPLKRIVKALRASLAIAEEEGIDKRRIVLDPGIGFFREEGRGPAFSKQKVMPWYLWDIQVIRNLRILKRLGFPVCLSLSRKSFIGKVLGIENPEERLFGSIGATVIAVEKGANIIRTHDVMETVQAVRMAEAIIRS